MSKALEKSLAAAKAKSRMTARQRTVWKARQMIGLRLEQAAEAKANGNDGHRRWCVESALRWRAELFA